MDLKKLREQAHALASELERIPNEIEAAQKTSDATKVKALEEQFKGKSEEFKSVENKIEIAKANQARRAKLVELDKLNEPEFDGKTIPEGRIPAQARDRVKEEEAYINVCLDYFEGKSLSDNQFELVKPKGKGWKTGNDGNAIALPERFARRILPEAFKPGPGFNVAGKALPSTSTGAAGESSLYQPDFQMSLLQYPGEAPAIFPRTNKIPCRYGTILWPQLVQAKPGAEGSNDEFAEYGYMAMGWTAEGAEAPGTEAKFKQVSISTFELAGHTEMSRQLLSRSTVNIEELFGTLARAAALHKIDLALIAGDGNGKPTGVLQTANIGNPARTTTGHVKYADFINLETQIAPQLRPGLVWVIADTALQDVKLQVDGQGRPLFLPLTSSAGTMTAGNMGTILGYPVIPTQRTTLGQAGPVGTIGGDLIALVPDRFVCPVEQEILVARSEHAKITQGLVVLVIFMQVGGKFTEPRAAAALAQ